MMRTASTTTWTGTERQKRTPTLVKGRSCSGMTRSVSCWRRTQWEFPWRGRMKKRRQRWYLLGKKFHYVSLLTFIHLCNSLSSSPQVLSLVSPLRLLLLSDDWKQLESHLDAREDTPIFIYNSRWIRDSLIDEKCDKVGKLSNLNGGGDSTPSLSTTQVGWKGPSPK